ncbi:hypothetical protein AMTRI_Chr07g25530 [Amborella trichopoda]
MFNLNRECTPKYITGHHHIVGAPDTITLLEPTSAGLPFAFARPPFSIAKPHFIHCRSLNAEPNLTQCRTLTVGPHFTACRSATARRIRCLSPYNGGIEEREAWVK